MDPVMVGYGGGPVIYEQLWLHLRHGVAVVGWVIVMGLIAAASCWCCGYVARGNLARDRSPHRSPYRSAHRSPYPSAHRSPDRSPDRGRRRPDDRELAVDDAAVAAEAARGIRDIELYLSSV